MAFESSRTPCESRLRAPARVDGATLADDYLRTLWRLLALVCVPGTIHYEIVPSFIREELLNDPTTLDARAPAEMRAALRLTCAERLDSWIGFVACC